MPDTSPQIRNRSLSVLNRSRHILTDRFPEHFFTHTIPFVITLFLVRLWIISGFLSQFPAKIFASPSSFTRDVLPGTLTALPGMLLLSLALYALCAFGRWTRLLRALNATVILLYLAGLYYFFFTQEWFTSSDFRVMHGANMENTWELLSAAFNPFVVLLQIAAAFILFHFLRKRQRLNFSREKILDMARRYRMRIVTAMLALFIALPVFLLEKPFPWSIKFSGNPVGTLCTTLLDDLFQEKVPPAPEKIAALFPDPVIRELAPSEGFSNTDPRDPLLRIPVARDKKALLSLDGKPGIVLFILESLTRQILDTPGIAPAFASLRRQSLQFDRIYVNSFPSENGQEAIYYSDSALLLDGHSFKYHRNPSFVSILQNNGYRTGVFSACMLGMNRGKQFHARAGFAIQRFPFDFGVNEKGTQAAESVVLGKMLEYMENHTGNEPLMLTFLSAIGHAPFTYYPEATSIPKYRPGADGNETHYANQAQFALESVADFIKKAQALPKFRNTVFIITGDHAPHVPIQYEKLGLKSIDRADYFHEQQRVPLIIFIPGQNSAMLPATVTNRIGCQNDIGPTILDLLNIPPEKNRFMGQSLLGASFPEKRFILLGKKNAIYGHHAIDADNGVIRSITGLSDEAPEADLPVKLQALRRALGEYRTYFQGILGPEEFSRR